MSSNNDPRTVSSNINIQKGGIRQTSYSGQIIPRPINDGLGPSKPRSGDNYRNGIPGSASLSNNNNPQNRGRGSSTLKNVPHSQTEVQNLGSKNANNGYQSRYIN